MSSRALKVTLAGFAALGAAVLGAYFYERSHPPAPPAAPSIPTAAVPHPGDINGIPARRPEFTLAGLDGRPHPIAEWDGKALIVNFWATWCAPCRREIPLLNQLQKEFAPAGFQVIGIAVDFAEDVRAFKGRFAIDYPVLVGEQEGLDAARDFGVATMAFPFTAFTDSKGRLLTVHLGELHESTARAILAVVRRVDRGELGPLEARAAIKAALDALKAAEAPVAG